MQRAPMRPIVIALLALLFSAAADAESAERTSVALDYEIRLGGFHAGAVQLTATFDANRYRIAATTQSRGFIDMLVGFRSQARSEGERRGDEVLPALHAADNEWRGERRWVRLRRDGDGPRVQVHPPPELDDRKPVPPELRKGALDPLSAALRATLAAAAGRPCQRRLDVFDGRRRYALHFAEPRAEGRTLRCRVRLERIAGMSRDPWLPILQPIETAELWLAPVRPDLPPLPLKLRADTAFGAALVQLTAVDGAPP